MQQYVMPAGAGRQLRLGWHWVGVGVGAVHLYSNISSLRRSLPTDPGLAAKPLATRSKLLGTRRRLLQAGANLPRLQGVCGLELL